MSTIQQHRGGIILGAYTIPSHCAIISTWC